MTQSIASKVVRRKTLKQLEKKKPEQWEMRLKLILSMHANSDVADSKDLESCSSIDEEELDPARPKYLSSMQSQT